MSNRIDQEREAKLQPVRMQRAIDKLNELELPFTHDETTIVFQYNGNDISFFPYSGWHQGKGIKPGRGFDKLFNQLKK